MIATVTFIPADAPLGADGPALHRVLKHAGVGRASVVRVTGPSGLTAVLWLCRHGWERAAYVHANWVGAAGSVDALVVPHACDGSELTALLQSGDCLREGGVLIAQTASANPDAGLEPLPTLLKSLGYQLERGFCGKRREILIARRCGAPTLRNAA
jgi:hypothetical protein